MLRRTALCLALAALAACDSSTHPKPDPAGTVRVGAVSTGTLEPGETADELSAQLPGGEVRLLLQARSGSPADTLIAQLLDASGNLLGQVQSVGTDTALAGQASPWASAAAGRGKVRVLRRNPAGGGAYSLTLFPRDDKPEHVPATITLGQAVEGESVDLGGDRDVFRFTAAAGQQVVLFAQGLPGLQGVVRVELVDSASGNVVGVTDGFSGHTALEESSSGRLTLPHAGTWLVRVSGYDGFSETRGPYRFRVDAINPQPESGPAALALGAVAAETIGSVGDVDEYTFSAHAGQEMNLMARLESGLSAGVRFELLQGTQTLAVVEQNTPASSREDGGTGRITLPAEGSYTVRVSGPVAGIPASATGRYEFELYPVDRRPEVAATVALDAAPIAGSIERPGDVDEYTFSGVAGQLAVIHIASSGTVRGPLRADLITPDGSLLVSAQSEGQNFDAGRYYSRRVPLAASGTYTLRVAAAAPRGLASGPFTLEAYTVNPAPEHVPATMQVGQTVTGEAIDRPGDLDVFTLAGQPGAEVNLFLGWGQTDAELFGYVLRPGDTAPVIFTYAGTPSLDGTSTGRLGLESGTYTITVDPAFAGQQQYTGSAGPYGLRIFPIDHRPEGRTAAYTLGETVSAEPLYPAGDVDEYTFTLATTTRLAVTWDAPFTGPGDAVTGILRNAAGQDVWNNFFTDNGQLVRDITLPAGTYRLEVLNFNVRVFGGGSFNQPTLNYRFAFVPH